MGKIENRTKSRLEAGQLALGIGLRQARTVDIATIAATAGYDWLFIDMEHNSMSVDTAAQISVAAIDTGVTPIVRVPGHEAFHASRLLDNGALGIVVPHVNDAAEARRAVSQCRFPPLGHRSVVGGLPQLRFEAMPMREAMEEINATTIVVVMIETPAGLDEADAIAAVEGVDVLLVGASDLSAELGIAGEFSHPRIESAIRKVVEVCRRHGKHPGLGGIYDQALMERYIGLGCRFILGGSDLSFLMAGATSRSSFLHSVALAEPT